MLETSRCCRGHFEILRESMKSPPPRRLMILFLALLDVLVVSQDSFVSIVGFAIALIVLEQAVHTLHVTFVAVA